MNGFELILPFLRPIQHLILDPEISEIMVNGSERVFIERQGHLEEIPGLNSQPEIPGDRRQKHRPAARRRHL